MIEIKTRNSVVASIHTWRNILGCQQAALDDLAKHHVAIHGLTCNGRDFLQGEFNEGVTLSASSLMKERKRRRSC